MDGYLKRAEDALKTLDDMGGTHEDVFLAFAPGMTGQAQALALFAIAEQLKRIADALGSIDTVMTNASGSEGALQVHALTFDGGSY